MMTSITSQKINNMEISAYAIPGIVNIIKPETYINYVLDVLELTLDEFKNKSRKRDLVDARMIIVHTLRTRCHLSYHKIGNLINRDHSAVIYLYQTYSKLIENNTIFKEKTNLIGKMYGV